MHGGLLLLMGCGEAREGSSTRAARSEPGPGVPGMGRSLAALRRSEHRPSRCSGRAVCGGVAA